MKKPSIQYDISDTAISIVLTQLHGSMNQPVAYLNRALASSKWKYSALNRELATIFTHCKKNHTYIDSQCMVVFTDYKPLIHLRI